MRSGMGILFASALACQLDVGGIGGTSDGSGDAATTSTAPGTDSTTAAGTTTTGSTAAPADDTTSTSTSTSAPTASTTGDASSSDSGVELELCDGVDNDSDGAIDEPSTANLACADCTSIILESAAFTTCTGEMSWEDARARCTSLGGDLASFADLGEQQAVVASASGDRWIGLTDAAREDTWTWADGTAPTYEDWRATEPDDWPPGEDCGQIRGGDGGWGDATCASLRDYVCEIAVE